MMCRGVVANLKPLREWVNQVASDAAEGVKSKGEVAARGRGWGGTYSAPLTRPRPIRRGPNIRWILDMMVGLAALLNAL